MTTNYLKIAFRTLSKNRLYTVLNVCGLAIGLATCLAILLYVYDELSYDRFNEKADRIVRVVFRANINGGEIKEPFAMPPTAQALRNDYPEVLDATRLRVGGNPIVQYGENIYHGASFASVDPNFFQIFTLPLIQGDAKTALKDPNTVVITKAMATQYFGKEDPLGKVLKFKGWDKSYQVTGVIEKVPDNCHFHFDLFGSMENVPESKLNTWMTSEFYTYLLLPEGYDYKQLEAKMPQVLEKYMGPEFQAGLGMSLAEFRNKGNAIGLFLQPLTDIHLHSDFTFSLSPGGDIQYVYIFGAIALFMLLIACINFMNLSTAGAAKRAKEVGIRKALGSAKSELVRQFLTESVLLTLCSTALATGLVALALPYLNTLTGKNLDMHFLSNPVDLSAILLFSLLVGAFAGTYPAFFLSAFKPISVLKGIAKPAKGGIGLRSGLVVFQFLISVGLIIGTIVVKQQLSYIQNKKLGFNKDSILLLQNSGVLGDKEAVFRDKLQQDPRVAQITTSSFKPVGPTNNNNTMVYPDGNQNQLMKTLRYGVDETYIPTLGMKMVSGRNFSKDFSTDTSAVVINEAAARAFGWGKEAVGHVLTRTMNNAASIKYEVIGVVEDFHFKSLHEQITPLLMMLENNPGLIVKTQTKDLAGLLASIKAEWAQFNVDEPLDYAFMDDLYEKTYQTEQKVGSIFGVFAGLTIFIACLGLFGLAAFTAEQRTKEIGVRKVLGASVAGITRLLAIDFLQPVLLAIVIASPLAYYGMQKWLADFAYRIELKWWVFAGAGIVALIIAFLTVSFQSVRAALANPVKSLRNE